LPFEATGREDSGAQGDRSAGGQRNDRRESSTFSATTAVTGDRCRLKSSRPGELVTLPKIRPSAKLRCVYRLPLPSPNRTLSGHHAQKRPGHT
jgi:hypothetical protein